MLAFGVVIGGAFSSGGLGALANTIVVAVRPSVQQAAQVVTTVASGGGGGGGGGGHAQSPRANGGGGGGGGVASSAATTVPAAPAQAPVTVTVSQSESTNPSTGTTPQATLPSIDHVWLIVLGQQGYQQAWATSAGHPYLGTLRKQGELVPNYDAVASSPLANEVALLSGQGPTQQTVANCPTYTYIDPGTIGKQQQVRGDGCIYPQTTESLPQQFVADGLSWKAYVQGIGEGGCAAGGVHDIVELQFRRAQRRRPCRRRPSARPVRQPRRPCRPPAAAAKHRARRPLRRRHEFDHADQPLRHVDHRFVDDQRVRPTRSTRSAPPPAHTRRSIVQALTRALQLAARTSTGRTR